MATLDAPVTKTPPTDAASERREVKNTEQAADLSRSVQDSARENFTKKTDIATLDSTTSKFLSPLEIIDTQENPKSLKGETDSKHSRISESQNEEGKKIRIEGDGRTSEVQYDLNGRPKAYVDPTGEKFVRKDNKWSSRQNVVQPEGMDISIDENFNVKMKDNATGIVKTNRADGIKETAFPDGGKTTTKTVGDTEWISIESVNRQPRLLEMKDGQTQTYIDGEGNTFKRKDGEMVGKAPAFEKTNTRGEVEFGKFTVTADRSGNVVVRNDDRKNESDYAKRELNNGTVITSDANSKHRTVEGANSVRIETSFAENKIPSEKKITYPDGAGNLKLTYDKDGEIKSLEGNVKGEPFKLERSGRFGAGWTLNGKSANTIADVTENNGQVDIRHKSLAATVIDTNGTMKLTDGVGPKAKNLEASPLIQETPRFVDIKANIKEAQTHSVRELTLTPAPMVSLAMTTVDAVKELRWFKDKVNYGADWDFKKVAPEYEAFGNFHYGITGAAAGINEKLLRHQAGIAQVEAGTSKKEWGDPGTGYKMLRVNPSGNFGDDPVDQKWIKRGYDYYLKYLRKNDAT